MKISHFELLLVAEKNMKHKVEVEVEYKRLRTTVLDHGVSPYCIFNIGLASLDLLKVGESEPKCLANVSESVESK